MVHTKNTGTVFAQRATRRKRILLLQLADFNPHLTQRVTPAPRLRACIWRNFNPHPHTEDDLICVAKDFNYKSISIHILTRRMTPKIFRCQNPDRISIHILTRRMTEKASGVFQGTIHFNPHPHTEDDVIVQGHVRQSIAFQSTSSHGG